MGENSIGKPFVIGLRDDGRRLPVYSIEAGGSGRAYVSSRITRAETTANGWPDGRYRMMEGSHKASEETVC